jgi:hypothetical protein
MKILSKLISLIDRDKVVERKIVEYDSIEPVRQEVVYIACDRCKAPKLYRLGTDTSYLLHCFACDKIDRVVSL